MKRFIFSSLFLLFCSISLLAQTAAPAAIDPAIVDAILTYGILGFSVLTITQLIKEKLGLSGALVVILSLVVALAATALYFLTVAPPFTFAKLVGYGLAVWAAANGWYLFKTKAQPI